MDIPALEPTGELQWQLHCNENGYYESAKGFHNFVEEMDDIDLDLENIEDLDPDHIRDELTQEQLFALSAFNHLVLEYATFFHEDVDEPEDFFDGSETNTGLGNTLDSYLTE